MTTVDMEERDIQQVMVLHEESGFDYRFPKDFRTPLFPVKRVVIHGQDVIAGAALKVEAEAYLWMSHKVGTPEERLEAIETLYREMKEKATEIGFDQVHCALPPEIAERFGKRLEELGAQPTRPWPIYVFQLR